MLKEQDVIVKILVASDKACSLGCSYLNYKTRYDEFTCDLFGRADLEIVKRKPQRLFACRKAEALARSRDGGVS